MIAIKGMDIPKGCIGCKIGDSVLNCPCKGSTLIFDYQDKRHPECPLVEIVTCKDCKYNVKNGKNTTMCDIGHRFYMREHNTFYCTDAERKRD